MQNGSGPKISGRRCDPALAPRFAPRLKKNRGVDVLSVNKQCRKLCRIVMIPFSACSPVATILASASAAGGIWEPGSQRWLLVGSWLVKLVPTLRRETDALFRRAGIDLDGS
jgi:hypothetical protein